MKQPSHDSNPILRALAEEAAALPGMAAAEARRLLRKRHRRLCWTTATVAVTFAGLCVWQAFRLAHNTGKKPEQALTTRQKSSPAVASNPAGVALIQTIEETRNDPWRAPPDANEDQRNLLKTASGLPVLIVMDGPGKIARIHVIER